MANEFYVQIVDLAGNAQASKSFYVYPTKAAAQADISTNNGTGKQTTVESQPLSTDSSGECVFTVSDANVETVYVRAVSESYIEGIRTVTRPSGTDYSTATPATDGSDILLFVDVSDSNKIKRCTMSELATALISAAHLVIGDNDSGSYPNKLFFGSTTPGTPHTTGDIWFKPSA